VSVYPLDNEAWYTLTGEIHHGWAVGKPCPISIAGPKIKNRVRFYLDLHKARLDEQSGKAGSELTN